METFFNFIIGIAIVAGLVYLIIAMRKKLIAPRYQDAKGRSSVTYFITFKGVEIPELEQDTAFQELATVKYKNEDGYCVASAVNDAKLKDFLKTAYNLKPNQYTVSTRQLVY